MDEDRVLLSISLRQALARYFDERDQQILMLYFQLEQPDDFDEGWPPTYASVGRYVGTRLYGEPITEGSVRYRVELALKQLRELL